MRRDALTRLGAAFALLASAQYLIVEAIAAAAWRNPPYSYAVNFISDLGNPRVGIYEGSFVDSPLHALVNASFIVQGVLYILGAVLLLRGAPRVLGISLLALAVIHGVTTALVGIFPEGSSAMVGAVHVHSGSATWSIATGNIVMIVIGIAGRRLGALRIFRIISAALGVIGLLGGVLLLLDLAGPQFDIGIPERICVYTITLWGLILGGAILVSARHPQRTSAC